MVTEADALLLTLPLCSIHLCAFETHNARRHSEVRDVRIADVIKFENDGSTMVFRHPSEDFNTLSQLIVHESQEAVLFRDGQALDLFRAGRHTLTTQNIPLLGKLVNLPLRWSVALPLRSLLHQPHHHPRFKLGRWQY